ncbi:MAG: PAS domain-containing protein [Magnetococcales bacterium]|nr:PAS domain-containing protein [Magnetococcales bacterium]
MMDGPSEIRTAERVGEIYQALFDEAQLAQVLDHIKCDLAGDSILLRMQNRRDNAVRLNIASGYDPAWLRAYQEYFYQVDPYPRHVMNDMSIGVVDLGDSFLAEEVLRSEYYHDFLRPQHKYHCMGGPLLKTDQHIVLFGIQRNREGRAFRPEEARIVNLLVAHLQKILLINQQMADLSLRNHIAEQALSHMVQGVMVFDETLTVVYMNRAAEEILAGDSGIRLTRRGLETPVLAESRRLREMLRRGLRLAAGVGEPPRHTLPITPAGDGMRPFQAMVAPLRPEHRKMGILPDFPKVLLVLHTLDRATTSQATIGMLRDLYGLTGAECHLAGELANGRDLDEVARARGISMHTVRNQLKSIFSKTGVNRQVDLVRLVLTLPGGHGMEPPHEQP